MEIFIAWTHIEGEAEIVGAYSSLDRAKEVLTEIMSFDEEFDPNPQWSDRDRESSIEVADGSIGVVSCTTLDK